jgi:hypothetical protein
MAWVDDTFTGPNGTLPNPDIWTINNGSASGTCLLNNNKLRISIPLSANDESIQIISNFELSGEFDIQIDYENISYTSPSSSVSFLGDLRVYGSTYRYYIGFQRTPTVHYIFVYSNGGDNVQIKVSPQITSSKMKLTRDTSGNVKGYLWVNSQWEWNGNTSGYSFSSADLSDMTVRVFVSADFNGATTTDFDNFVVNSGTVIPDLMLEDFSLDLAAYHQKYDNMQMILQAHDGLEFRDFQMILEAIELTTTYKDFVMLLEALSQKKESFQLLLEAAKNRYKDFKMILEAADGTVFNNFMMILEASDGEVFNNFALHLQAIKATPAFRSVTAHRVSSVVHEVV